MTINSGSFSVTLDITESTTSGGKVLKAEDALTWSAQWADGDGDDQIEARWSNLYEAQAGVVTLDLTDLTDDFGNALAFTAVKSLFIENLDDAISLVYGNAANQWLGFLGAATHTITVLKKGALFLCAPKTGGAVTGGTGDIMTFTPAAEMDFEIQITGITT